MQIWKTNRTLVFSHITSFTNKPWFLCVCCTSLLKTLWEKKKLLLTSNFSFSHSVFFSFGELSVIFHQNQNCCLQTLSVWKSLKFDVWERVKFLCTNNSNSTPAFRLEKCLFPKRQIFHSSKLKEFAEDNSKLNEKVLHKGTKHCGKRRNCLLQAIYPFPTVFSRLVRQTCKHKGLSGKGLICLTLWICQVNIPMTLLLTLSQTTILHSSKLKEFADDNFYFDENCRKFSKQVENTGKSRNCSLRVISPSPTVFSKDLYCRHVKTRACLVKG